MRTIKGFGYEFDGPYLTAKKGQTTPKGITYRDDFWNIALQRSAEAQHLLKELPLRHSEKLERKELALSIQPTTKWNNVEPRLLELRSGVRASVAEFVRRAEVSYLLRMESKKQARQRSISSK